MTEHSQETSRAAPQIQLDDFVEAITRGVARALQGDDDVSGYAAGSLLDRRFWFGFTIDPRFPGDIGTLPGGGGIQPGGLEKFGGQGRIG